MKRIKEIIKNLLPKIMINPIYLCQNSLFNLTLVAIDSASITMDEKWLDVGCGLRPYETYFPPGTYLGLDVDVSGRDLNLKSPDFFYDGRTLPFPNQTYDGIICTQVLEHVENPWIIISEIQRVLKPGGRLILSIPFAWQEHEAPYDFSRFSSFGITKILSSNGFEEITIKKDLSAIKSLAVLINVYISNNLSNKYTSYLVNTLICFPISLISIGLEKLLPDEGKFYLNLVVNAKKA